MNVPIICQILNSFLCYFLQPSSDENEIAQFVASLFAAIAECEQLSVRCRNRIPNSANFSLTSEVIKAIHFCFFLSISSVLFENELFDWNDYIILYYIKVEEELVSAIKNLEQSARIMDDVCSIASTQLSMLTGTKCCYQLLPLLMSSSKILLYYIFTNSDLKLCLH